MESMWKRMESMWKKYGIHVEKPWNPSPIPWNPSTKSMESIHQKYGIHPPFHGIHPPFHGIHLEFLQSIPPSMDSTWNNPGRVKYWPKSKLFYLIDFKEMKWRNIGWTWRPFGMFLKSDESTGSCCSSSSFDM